MSQEQAQHQETQDLGTVLANGIRLIGDTLIAPGSSQMLDGRVGAGIGRFVVGAAARAVLGPIGWLAVGLDSYAKSTSGRGILDRIANRNGNGAPAQAAPAQAAAAPAAAPAAPAQAAPGHHK